MKWEKLEGAGLEKVERMFRTKGNWYASAKKIRGKTVFLRDHGVTTLYVVGVDGHAYSVKDYSGTEPYLLLNQLVECAMMCDSSRYPRSGIYRNMKVEDA